MPAPKLLDAYGNPFASEELAPIARPKDIELYLQAPKIEILGAWDVNAAKMCATAHDLGQFTVSAPMYYAMMSDPFVTDGTSKRGLALSRMQFDIVPGKGRGAKHLARQLAKRYFDVMKPGIAQELYTFGLMMGLGVAQPEWGYYYEGDDLFYPWVRNWHPQLLYYILWSQANRQKAAPGQLYTYAMGSGSGNAATLIPIITGTGQWLQFTLMGGDKPWFYGKMRSVWRPWISIMMARLQWLRFNDVHGLPIREIQVPLRLSRLPDTRRAYRGIKNLGRDATLEMPISDDGKAAMKLNLVEAKSRSYGSFDLMMDREGREIMLTLVGGNEGVQAHGGNYKRAQEQMDVRHETKASDALSWEMFQNEQLLVPFAVLNGYEPEAAPRIVYDTRPPVNRQVEAQAAIASSKAVREFLGTVRELQQAGVVLTEQAITELLINQGLNLPDSAVEQIAAGLARGPKNPSEEQPAATAENLSRSQHPAGRPTPSGDLVRAYRFVGLGEPMQAVMRQRCARFHSAWASHVIRRAA